MKQINKEKFEKRVKSSEYALGLVYNGKTNEMKIVAHRNRKTLLPENMTDEDVVCLIQLLDCLNGAMFGLAQTRGLMPHQEGINVSTQMTS